jgi:hypothetical protein
MSRGFGFDSRLGQSFEDSDEALDRVLREDGAGAQDTGHVLRGWRRHRGCELSSNVFDDLICICILDPRHSRCDLPLLLSHKNFAHMPDKGFIILCEGIDSQAAIVEP